ncbi:MAG: sulfurtransferase/chromate resistance protein [Pseudomonadota bacterium]
MTSPCEITTPQLYRLIGTPDCPLIFDVRTNEDFDDDPRLIPGARRHAWTDIEGLAERCTSPGVIVYCQKGLKISQGCVALLRNRGISAEWLGGGQFAWRDARLPLVPNAAIPALDAQNRTIWVARQRPKIDRIACPWLIRRFVDRNALFLFVQPTEVKAVAARFNATAFDIEGSPWSHRGEFCTFDMMVERFGLSCQPIDRLARIVRGADTNRHDLAPQAAGLMAASLGLSRIYKDDLAQLDAGMLLYDAFYRWARDAFNEGHDCPDPAKITMNHQS